MVVQSGAGPDGKYRRRVDNSIVDAVPARRAPVEGAAPAQHPAGAIGLSHRGEDLRVVPPRARRRRRARSRVGDEAQPAPGTLLRSDGRRDDQRRRRRTSRASSARATCPRRRSSSTRSTGASSRTRCSSSPLPGVVIIKSVDGLGPAHSKIETYDYLMATIRHGRAPRLQALLRRGHAKRQPHHVAERGPRALRRSPNT